MDTKDTEIITITTIKIISIEIITMVNIKINSFKTTNSLTITTTTNTNKQISMTQLHLKKNLQL
jgi:hypothetical protein